MKRVLRSAALSVSLILLLPLLVAAEVARVEITARRDVAGGKAFGSAGPYEQIVAKLYFVIDPANRRNQVIADLDKAPKNAAGKIEMSADLVIVRPRDTSRGNGIALFDIVNRGNTTAFTAFNGPTNLPDNAGDGFLLNRGYTIVQVGWEFDARREGAVRIDVPGAVGVTGLVRGTVIPGERGNTATVTDLVGYSPSDAASPQNTLRVRKVLGGEWTTIARDKWRLSGNTVTLDGGFEPGQTYELAYVVNDPPVAGLGLAAVRDAASWIRYTPGALASAKYLFTYGQSQTGRWLRDYLYEGFNTDERNRQLFDAVMPHIAGGAGVRLDERWSTPTALLMETASHFPFSDVKQRDPVTGIEDGVLDNPRAREHQPKILYTYSDTEYWQRSVALVHTTPDGAKDITPPANVRLYHFAGAPHNIGRFPPTATNGQLADNPYDLRVSLRALLVAAEKWVRDGTAPPPSRYPRLQDGTLVRWSDVAFPAVPGAPSPRKAIVPVRGPNRLIAKDGAGTALPYLVPQVDRDGNSLGGLRLPEIAVPLATYAGWNFRSTNIGGTEQFFPLIGSYVPFAATKAQREQSGDPRMSIEERYATRDRYLAMIQESAAALVKDGYLLADDLAGIVKHAGEHWDLLARRASATTTAAR
jgi:hypothetical protein